jgi:hypothetical protein
MKNCQNLFANRLILCVLGKWGETYTKNNDVKVS